MKHSRVRFSVRRVMVGVAVLAVASVGAYDPPTATPVGPEDPMTIAASCVGDFAEGRSWYLSVNSAGEAELTIATFPRPTRRRFLVPRQRLSELRRALAEERFLDLAGEYGQVVPDGSATTLTVTVGERSRSVRLNFLMNWVRGDKAKLREPSRAVRIAVMIRGWFDDAGAVDLRRFDRMVLDAVGK
jgi:hypothetical protein